MSIRNASDPAVMTVEERLAEIASLLALGLMRLRTSVPGKGGFVAENDLGFPAAQRVHANPASRVRSAVRKALLASKKESE